MYRKKEHFRRIGKFHRPITFQKTKIDIFYHFKVTFWTFLSLFSLSTSPFLRLFSVFSLSFLCLMSVESLPNVYMMGSDVIVIW